MVIDKLQQKIFVDVACFANLQLMMDPNLAEESSRSTLVKLCRNIDKGTRDKDFRRFPFLRQLRHCVGS